MDLLVDLYRFLMERKKFWLVPVIIALLLIGLLIMVSGTAVAPFIYTIF